MRSIRENRSLTISSVPNVSHTGIRKRVANAATPPMWSACSCVTRIALIDSGARPRRHSRATVSRTRKPQSIRTRVCPTSTTSALPSLPLPSDAKRIVTRWRPVALFQLVAQQRENLVARLRAVRGAVGILHADGALRSGLDDLDPVLLGLVLLVGLPEVQHFRQEALLAVLLRHVGVGIGEPDEINAGRAIAIDDGEAGAVECQPDPSP